jgi:hypothetical protein
VTRTGIGLSLLAFCTLAHAGSLSCLTGGVSYVPAQPWPFDSIVVSAWAVRPCTGGKAPLCYDALPARIGATVQVAAGTIEVDVYGSDGALPAGVPLLATPAAGAYDEFLELPVAAIAPGKYGFRHRVHNVDALGATTTCELFNVYPRTVNVRGVDGPVERRTAVEYYHAALDHYFVTAEPAEIADLDAGVHAGWARTGGTFAVFSPGKSGGTGVPVCRFYGLPGAGLDSHFYTANAAECAEIPVKYKGTWQLESANAFEVWLPEDVAPYCDLGTRSIARLWNQRTDSNHRFTTDGNVLSAMSQRGYVMEGVGWPSPVSMCSP